jgi:6-phosphofructokinase
LEIYGVKNIVGIQFGYRGFFEKGLKEMPLSRKVVENINLSGGSFLGVSRGGAKTSEIVDSIQARRIDMLFVIGGNGSHAGANAIHEEVDISTLHLICYLLFMRPGTYSNRKLCASLDSFTTLSKGAILSKT